MRIQSAIRELLICPACGSHLADGEGILRCESGNCGEVYPIVDGIPILINEKNSIFRLSDYREGQNTFYNLSSQARRGKKRLASLIPDFALNFVSPKNYAALAERLRERSERPKILVIGGSVFNWGMEPLLSSSFELIESDVSFGSRTSLILDAHDIPFESNTIDVVIVQAVLEHVLDPVRCVEEIHRVLRNDGLVYAETPFMQQVHAGPYDFTRFSHVGHRRLFRHFSELDSGPVVGPAVALASAWCHFLVAMSDDPLIRKFLLAFGQCTSFWIKWIDYYLMTKKGSFDAGFGYYFLGQYSDTPLSDREILETYKGGISLLKPR